MFGVQSTTHFVCLLIGRGLNVKFSTTHMQARFWRQLQNARPEPSMKREGLRLEMFIRIWLRSFTLHSYTSVNRDMRRSLLYFHEGVVIQSHAELGTQSNYGQITGSARGHSARGFWHRHKKVSASGVCSGDLRPHIHVVPKSSYM